MSWLRRGRRSVEAATRVAEDEAEELARRRAGGPDGPGDANLDPGKVLVGAEGCLFLQNDGNDTIGQYTGRLRLSRRQRRAWSALIEERIRVAVALGAAWRCWIVPDKTAVYSDLLPPGVVPAERRPVDDILEIAARAGAPFAYPLEELRSARGDGWPPVFPATHNHWTQFGAFVVYETTCRDLRGEGLDVAPVPREAIEWRRFETPGDLGSKLEPAPTAPTVRPEIRDQRSRLTFDNQVLNHGRVMVFERDDGVGPTALVLGQSSTNYLLIFLKESFRRLTFVHTATVPREVLEWERPDVILTYPGERFMIRVPDDSTGLRQIAETVRVKRERDAARPATGWFFQGIPGIGDVRNDFELPWPASRVRPPSPLA